MNDTLLTGKSDSTTSSNTTNETKSYFSGSKEERTSPDTQAGKIQESMVKQQSTIGENIKFRGELIGTEDLHIEGTVEGTVIMEGQNLSIGESGTLNANIHAQNLVINGSLTGDVLADELIEIKKTAVVKGSLIAPRIQLDDGGKFRGAMDMIDTEEEKKERHAEFKQKLIHPDLPVLDDKTRGDSTSTLEKKTDNLAKTDDKLTADNNLKTENASKPDNTNPHQSKKDFDKKKNNQTKK